MNKNKPPAEPIDLTSFSDENTVSTGGYLRVVSKSGDKAELRLCQDGQVEVKVIEANKVSPESVSKLIRRCIYGGAHGGFTFRERNPETGLYRIVEIRNSKTHPPEKILEAIRSILESVEYTVSLES